MKKQRITIGDIPALVWGEPSDKAFLFVHGKMASKEAAELFASVAEKKGYQTLSFDLPAHGERADRDERCDIKTGLRDLPTVKAYADKHWKDLSLFGCSLGAYLSLNAFKGEDFRQCLFQSPIADMQYLVGQMMQWFGVTEERLEREQEIETPVDLMTWESYQYIKTHPVTEWNVPTSILYAGKDNLQSFEVIKNFADRFGCKLTVSENSEHPFMAEGDDKIVEKWIGNAVAQ